MCLEDDRRRLRSGCGRRTGGGSRREPDVDGVTEDVDEEIVEWFEALPELAVPEESVVKARAQVEMMRRIVSRAEAAIDQHERTLAVMVEEEPMVLGEAAEPGVGLAFEIRRAVAAIGEAIAVGVIEFGSSLANDQVRY